MEEWVYGREISHPPSLPSTHTAKYLAIKVRLSKGLRTAIYTVPDIDEAKAWYAEALGTQPYFDEPFYVGFDVGGYELGLMPEDGAAEDSVAAGPGGVVAYWGVEDADAALAHLEAQGAAVHEGVRDVGDGIRTAVARDPFGNLLGVIENPHFQLPDAP